MASRAFACSANNGGSPKSRRRVTQLSRDLRRDGNSEEERAALTGRALHPDAATMGLNNTLGDGKSQPRTSSLGPRRLPEAIEHARQLIALDAASRVRHRKQYFACARFCTQNDFSVRVRELYRVADEVFEHLEEPVAVCPDVGKVLQCIDTKLERRRGCQLRLRIKHLGKDIAHANTFLPDRECTSVQEGHIVKIPDQAPHAVGGVRNFVADLA